MAGWGWGVSQRLVARYLLSEVRDERQWEPFSQTKTLEKTLKLSPGLVSYPVKQNINWSLPALCCYTAGGRAGLLQWVGLPLLSPLLPPPPLQGSWELGVFTYPHHSSFLETVPSIFRALWVLGELKGTVNSPSICAGSHTGQSFIRLPPSVTETSQKARGLRAVWYWQGTGRKWKRMQIPWQIRIYRKTQEQDKESKGKLPSKW